MSGRKVLLYFAWSRPGETTAPVTVIDDRFPAIFELRRLFYPQFEELADPQHVDQGIGGFLDHVQKLNFAGFVEQTERLTGNAVVQVERITDDGAARPLDAHLVGDADTIVVISFDSSRTLQTASADEILAMRQFLADPDHVLFLCPHHEIGNADEEGAERQKRQLAEHLHHGDRGIPPRQGFGGFARTLLAGLGLPVANRFGLRPAAAEDGGPADIEIDLTADRLDLLRGVRTFNLHPHLPQLERTGEAVGRMDVLARQPIDLAAPPHPFTADGRTTFDALLQSRPDAFPGTVLVSDTTLFSATVGGLESLSRLWSNLVQRARR